MKRANFMEQAMSRHKEKYKKSTTARDATEVSDEFLGRRV